MTMWPAPPQALAKPGRKNEQTTKNKGDKILISLEDLNIPRIQKPVEFKNLNPAASSQ
jgi:hypothetical protein